MKRPLVWMAAALVLGEWMAQYGRTNCMVFFCVGVVLTMGCHLIALVRKQDRRRGWFEELICSRTILCIPYICLFGMWSMQSAAAPSGVEVLLEQQETEDGLYGIEAVVVGCVEEEGPDGAALRLCIKAESVNGQPISSGRLLVKAEEAPIGKDGALRYPIGSRVAVHGWLYRFPKALNPGQFDTRTFYAGRNIQAGLRANQLELLQTGTVWLPNRMLQLRIHLMHVLAQVCEGTDVGFFQAVVLGLSDQIDEQQKDLFQTAGIAHLLSISGLHISCMAMVVYRLIRRGSGSYLVGMAGGSLFLLCYGCMIGGRASAVRAMLMFGLQMYAACHGRKYDLLSAAAFAAVSILLEYPFQLYQSGFWLSFLAVIGIGTIVPVLSGFLRITGRGQSVLVVLAVQAAVLPVILYSGYCYPVYGIGLNLVVIPLAGYLLFSGIGAALAGSLSIAAGIFCAGTGHVILRIYDSLCLWIQGLPHARRVTGQPRLWQCFLYYGLLALILGLIRIFGKEEQEEAEPVLPEARRRRTLEKWSRCICVLAVFLGLYTLLECTADGKLHITMLDVGQGECIHIQTPHGRNVLIDGGSLDVEHAGTYRIVPYLLSQGAETIDLLILTHPDADHTNGIRELAEDGRIRIGTLCLAEVPQDEEWQEILRSVGMEASQVHWMAAGETVTVDSVQFFCLHPYAEYRAEDTNSNSLVLRLEYGDSSMLLTGDLPTAAEDFLAEVEDVDVLKVAHHGSKHANSAELITQCQPELAVISCGAHNRYGHPHAEVLERLEAVGCECYVTAGRGALLLETDGENWQIQQYGKK